MKASVEVIQEVRELIASSAHGVLSTLSVHLEGAPFASVATFCTDYQGRPLLYMSTIAQHTINRQADDRASLIALAGPGVDAQAEARVTLNGRLVKLEDEELLKRYFRYFPQAEKYSEFHDFDLYRLEPSKVRYIGGFGKIYWIEPEEVLMENPFSAETETFIIEHMNDHHADNLMDYLRHYGAQEAEQPVTLIGVDDRGMDLLYTGMRKRLALSRAISNGKEAREVMTEMAKEARESLAASQA